MSWRARVGLFNGIKPIHSRSRRQYSKSDIAHCVIAIYNIYAKLFQPYSSSIQYPFHSHFISLLQLPLFIFFTCHLAYIRHTPSGSLSIKVLVHYLLIYLPILLIISGNIHPNPGPVNKNYTICHLNARSLKAPNRINEIRATLVNIHSFDLIAATETHLDQSVQEHEVELPSYHLHRNDRNRNGGGVAIYSRDHLGAVRRYDLENPDIEIIWVEVRLANKKHLIASCYRPPGQTRTVAQHFLTLFKNSVEAALLSNPFSLTILGDLNDRCTLWDSLHSDSELKNDLHTLLLDLGLFQLINTPTRGNHVLDLLISDSPIHFYDIGTLPSFSSLDHDIIYGKFQYSYSSSSNYVRRIWKYDLGNYSDLNNDISNNLTIPATNDLDQVTSHLTNHILNCMNKHIPNTKVIIRPKDKPWYTPEVKALYKQTNRLFHLKNRTKNPIHIQKFKTKRHEAKEAFRTARKNYYQTLSNNILDPDCTPKTFWKLVKNVYNNNNQSSIPTLIDNGILYTNDSDKAEVLNNYFVSQTVLPPSNIPLPPMHYLTDARLD